MYTLVNVAVGCLQCCVGVWTVESRAAVFFFVEGCAPVMLLKSLLLQCWNLVFRVCLYRSDYNRTS